MPAARSASLASSPGWKRVFSRTATSPGASIATACAAVSLAQSATNITGRPIAAATLSVSRLSDIAGFFAPFGRPKCDSSRTIAPRPASSVTVGAIAASPRRIADLTLGHRHIEVDADEDAFAREVGGEIIKRLEIHRLTIPVSYAVRLQQTRHHPGGIDHPVGKAHSLSYQETTRTNVPSITAVSRLSIVELAGLWL